MLHWRWLPLHGLLLGRTCWVRLSDRIWLVGRMLADVDLGPLSQGESEELLYLLLHSAALPSALERSIIERGGGSPPLFEEMVRMLLAAKR